MIFKKKKLQYIEDEEAPFHLSLDIFQKFQNNNYHNILIHFLLFSFHLIIIHMSFFQDPF
jgi:hypothetical protein